MTKAYARGSGGCFLIFKVENYEDFTYKLDYANPLQELKEVAVKSVKILSKDCAQVSVGHDKNHVTIVISIGVAVVVCLTILIIVLYKKKTLTRERGHYMDDMI